MLRSKSAAPAPCSSAAPYPPLFSKKPASSTPQPSRKSSKSRAPISATPTISTISCKPSSSIPHPKRTSVILNEVKDPIRIESPTHTFQALRTSQSQGGPHPPSVWRMWERRRAATQLTRWMHQLVETHRAVFASVGDREFWVASEKSKDFRSIYVDVSFSPDPPELPATASNARSNPRPRPARLDAAHRTIDHRGTSDLFAVVEKAILPNLAQRLTQQVNSASETIIHKRQSLPDLARLRRSLPFAPGSHRSHPSRPFPQHLRTSRVV